MPPRIELAKDLISYQEWVAVFWLFLSGIAVTAFKRIRSREKITSIWQVVSVIILGGFITAGIGGFLLWIFPTMPFYIAMMITGALSTLLESRDIHDIILVRMGVNTNNKEKGQTK